MTKIQNMKKEPSVSPDTVLVIEYLNLEFICYLVLVFWNLWQDNLPL